MNVLTEFETMQQVERQRFSIARFGRCELKIIEGKDGLCQRALPSLSRRLLEVLNSKLPQLMVCIPRLWPTMPPGKERWYGQWQNPKLELFDPANVYGSTFISRRDAWVGMLPGDEEAYWLVTRRIWRGREVLLVAGSHKGLIAKDSLFLKGARDVEILQAPGKNAWIEHKDLLEEILAWAEKQVDPLVYLSLGATATVLAHDLCRLGVQALDLGHMAQSWLKTGKQAIMAA